MGEMLLILIKLLKPDQSYSSVRYERQKEVVHVFAIHQTVAEAFSVSDVWGTPQQSHS